MRWLMAVAVTVAVVAWAQAPAGAKVASKGPATEAGPAAPQKFVPCTNPIIASDGGVLDGAKLFNDRTCLACHGKDAKTPLLPEYPRLAGQQPFYAERQMKDIKYGVRNNGNTAAMKGVMVLVNEEEIHALACYISTLK